MPTPYLTPYDTGARCEPRVWPTPTQLALEKSSSDARAIEEDRFGRVDFDNDEATTVCTVHIERGEDGRYVVVIGLRHEKPIIVVDDNGARTSVNALTD
ncbi:hypothetical protein [Nocardiopsis alborubida]|uniref:Uncharacterized protein n=1 Tax=Nocardiopsis alborubida TaxID=146802 RepID=A0A7X6M8E9_9ACTN|nr:hypothetical protein [Nocardiopsis alborubida]NKY96588.1 hypothetical protein [Nocardiopsis alborubida]